MISRRYFCGCMAAGALSSPPRFMHTDRLPVLHGRSAEEALAGRCASAPKGRQRADASAGKSQNGDANGLFKKAADGQALPRRSCPAWTRAVRQKLFSTDRRHFRDARHNNIITPTFWEASDMRQSGRRQGDRRGGMRGAQKSRAAWTTSNLAPHDAGGRPSNLR